MNRALLLPCLQLQLLIAHLCPLQGCNGLRHLVPLFRVHLIIHQGFHDELGGQQVVRFMQLRSGPVHVILRQELGKLLGNPHRLKPLQELPPITAHRRVMHVLPLFLQVFGYVFVGFPVQELLLHFPLQGLRELLDLPVAPVLVCASHTGHPPMSRPDTSAFPSRQSIPAAVIRATVRWIPRARFSAATSSTSPFPCR